jgi:hypothetical protein
MKFRENLAVQAKDYGQCLIKSRKSSIRAMVGELLYLKHWTIANVLKDYSINFAAIA